MGGRFVVADFDPRPLLVGGVVEGLGEDERVGQVVSVALRWLCRLNAASASRNL